MAIDPSTEYTDSLFSLSRTALGDTLRSVVHFTPDDFEVLYLRSDLGLDPSDAREAKADLVENERLGFSTRETYRMLTDEPGVEPSLGGYQFTLRVFSNGYVARVIHGEEGVLVTTDAMAARDGVPRAVRTARSRREQTSTPSRSSPSRHDGRWPDSPSRPRRRLGSVAGRRGDRGPSPRPTRPGPRPNTTDERPREV